MAGLAVAAGAIAGSLFGTTRQERRFLGPVGDEINDAAKRLNEQANRKVAEYAHKVEDVAEAASGKIDEVADKVPTGQGEKNGGEAKASGTTDRTGYTPASQPTGTSMGSTPKPS